VLWPVGNDLRFVLVYYKSDCTLYFLWVLKFIFVNASLVIFYQVYVNVIIHTRSAYKILSWHMINMFWG
jgi:hypothetical protein